MSEELLLARFNRVILFSQPQKKASARDLSSRHSRAFVLVVPHS
jgi:hypothetical protein